MLQTLREKTSGWLATVILGLLIVPFAFVGVQDYFVQRTDQPVATVHVPPQWWQDAPAWWPARMLWESEEISQQEFRERFEQERQQQRETLGERYDARTFDSAENKRAVLDTLIDQRVQRLWAQQHGLVVSNAMVRKTIAGIPAFQVDGRFDIQRYRLGLSAQGQTEQQFERLVREGLEQSLLATSVGASSFVTAGEFGRLIALLGERRDVSLVEVPPPPADAAPVAASEVEAWYRAHPEDFRAPETVTVEYVELNAAAMPAPVVDEAALRQRYEKEKSRYVAQEQRLASHILVTVPEGANAAADAAARAKATQLAAQARAPGADFATLARASSDDPGSKATGGDLGWVGRGMMTGPFENALFGMKAGQISDPVKTEFGWHVIQLREIQSGQQQSFEEARANLESEYLEAERERAFNALSSRVVDAVLKDPSALAPAAREAGLPVRSAGPLARGQGEGVLAAPGVQRWMFSESAIQAGMVSDPIEIAPNHSVVARVVAHSPARTPPLAQVRDRVIAAVRADRAEKAATQRVERMVARVRAGETLAAVAAADGLAAPRALQGVPRGAPLGADGVSEAVFAATAPAGKPGVGSKVLDNGLAVVFTVERVTPGTLTELPPAQLETLKSQVADIKGSQEVDAMLRAIRRPMKIEVNEANF